jgi:hypothetical protein
MALTRYNPLAIITRWFKALFPDQKITDRDVTPLDRRSVYAHLWNYYINQVYMRTIYGGSLDFINESLGEAAARDISGLINPVEQVVELYAQNTFAGNFGDEITIDEQVGDSLAGERTVNAQIREPLSRIFKWSNINAEKDRLARYASLFGDCGIRVVAKVGRDYPNDPIEDRRVYLQFEHPATIEDFDEDNRGNITQILNVYRVLEGDIDIRGESQNREYHVYKMLMTRTGFETLRDDQPFNNVTEAQDGKFSSYGNLLGFVPYVTAHFRKHDHRFGAWCFIGTEQILDRVNALITHILRQIWRHVNVTWLVTTSGAPPSEYHFGGQKILHIVRKLTEDAADTNVEPLIAQLSLADALAVLKFLVEQVLPDRMPELKAIQGTFLSGQSGETVAHLRKPAEDKLLVFRANMEDALSRACKMALSYGILLGLWNAGTGIGTPEAANRAFQQGLLDFRFNKRPALSLTEGEKLQNEKLQKEIENSGVENDFLNEGRQPQTKELPASNSIN